jgi:hypothetical protein
MFPWDVSGTVTVPLTLLIFAVVFVWHVSQTKAPYLPPGIPHPFAPHLFELRFVLLWSMALFDQGLATVVVTIPEPVCAAWFAPSDALMVVVRVCPTVAPAWATTVRVELLYTAPGASAPVVVGASDEGRVKLPVLPVSDAKDSVKVELPQNTLSLFVTVTVYTLFPPTDTEPSLPIETDGALRTQVPALIVGVPEDVDATPATVPPVTVKYALFTIRAPTVVAVVAVADRS